MIEPDFERIRELRAEDSDGLRSNDEIERQATLEKLRQEVVKIEDDRLRDILETITQML